jgi:hypothetical protein
VQINCCRHEFWINDDDYFILCAIGVHSGRPARPDPSPKRLGTFNFGSARLIIKFGPCRAGPRADPSAHGPARIELNVPGFKRATRKL